MSGIPIGLNGKKRILPETYPFSQNEEQFGGMLGRFLHIPGSPMCRYGIFSAHSPWSCMQKRWLGIVRGNVQKSKYFSGAGVLLISISSWVVFGLELRERH